MAGGCFLVTEANPGPLYGDMVDISTSKITNLWPATQSRPVEKAGLKDKSSQNQQRNKKNQKSNRDIDEDGPGKNIDEYA